MQLDDIYVAGTGVYFPEPMPTARAVELGQYDAGEAEFSGLVSVLVAGAESPPEMAVSAGLAAIERSGHSAEDISVLIHSALYHQGPDIWPAHIYIQRYAVGRDVPAFELRQACNGGMAAMEMAAYYLAADPGRTAALLTTADNFGGLNFDRWNAEKLVVFADGGTALVLSRRPGVARVAAMASTSIPILEEMQRDVAPYPFRYTGHGPVNLTARRMFYQSQSPEDTLVTVDALIGEAMPRVVEQTLTEAGIKRTDVARVIWPNLARLIVNRYSEQAGIDESLSLWEWGRTVGHLGAGDQFAGLHHLLDTAAVSSGDWVLMVGIGVGLTISCAAIQIC